jgi:hypothetical protein
MHHDAVFKNQLVPDGVVITNRPYMDTYLFVIRFWSVTETSSCPFPMISHVDINSMQVTNNFRLKWLSIKQDVST